MSEHRPQTESELVDYLRSVDVRAPDELHGRVQALIADADRAQRRSLWARGVGARPALALRLGGAATALAAVAVALVLALSGGGATLTLREASALTLRPATMAAPAQSPGNPSQLAVAVDGVAFPYWEDRFGWRASGSRVDRIDGRAVTTVFYTDRRDRRVGYAIVAGTPAPAADGGRIVWREGTPFRLMRENGARIVTWVRDGHLCVVSGEGMGSATLLRLASWNDGGVAA
ncbi:MAG TPA: hypothetical protein VK778_12190 [Solirubrobacteraceae bacterium]|jgi:hypothetical protein|nr:hypothetical protein [Solirubrobacteraceae bacterium]